MQSSYLCSFIWGHICCWLNVTTLFINVGCCLVNCHGASSKHILTPVSECTDSKDKRRNGQYDLLLYTISYHTWNCTEMVHHHHPRRRYHQQPQCPLVGRMPQHAASKWPCLVPCSDRSCPSSIYPGRPSIVWLVSVVVFSCRMISKWWRLMCCTGPFQFSHIADYVYNVCPLPEPDVDPSIWSV